MRKAAAAASVAHTHDHDQIDQVSRLAIWIGGSGRQIGYLRAADWRSAAADWLSAGGYLRGRSVGAQAAHTRAVAARTSNLSGEERVEVGYLSPICVARKSINDQIGDLDRWERAPDWLSGRTVCGRAAAVAGRLRTRARCQRTASAAHVHVHVAWVRAVRARACVARVPCGWLAPWRSSGRVVGDENATGYSPG